MSREMIMLILILIGVIALLLGVGLDVNEPR